MPTSRVQTPNKSIASGVKTGFTLMEMLIVLGILSLLTGVAMINFMGKLGSSSFKREAMEIVNTLKMAQNAAAQSSRRYAVMFDFIEQTYTIKEIRSAEELMALQDIDGQDAGLTLSTTQLSDRCRIEFITFDDNDDTRDEGDIEDMEQMRSHFIAGRPGWQYGGKIGLTDIEGNEYSIIVNRMSKKITIEEGDDDINTYSLEPKYNLVF